nr:uncharacterized protein LOC109995500 [Labrus bergylta]
MAQECGACEDISGRVGGLHITVRKQSDGRVRLELCKTCKLYHCPFCQASVYKPKAEYANVWTHVEIHRMRALKHGEFNIHVCQLKCRRERHFHCPYCPRTIMTRKHFERHMNNCVEMQSLTRVKAAIPPSTPAQPVSAAGQRVILLVNLAAPLQQTVVMGQNPAPPKPFVKAESTSGQPPAQPKSTSRQPPASSDLLFHQHQVTPLVQLNPLLSHNHWQISALFHLSLLLHLSQPQISLLLLKNPHSVSVLLQLLSPQLQLSSLLVCLTYPFSLQLQQSTLLLQQKTL